jgi:hypothetical protein
MLFIIIWLLLLTAGIVGLCIKEVRDRCVWPVAIIVMSSIMYIGMMPAYFSASRIDDGDYTVNIVQLKEGTSGSLNGGGSFLGWTVSGENKSQYVVMEKFDDGRMIRRFLDQDDTYIIESNGTPRIEYRAYIDTYPTWRCWPYKKVDFNGYYTTKAKIYVPEGTVIMKFESL